MLTNFKICNARTKSRKKSWYILEGNLKYIMKNLILIKTYVYLMGYRWIDIFRWKISLNA